MSKRPTIIVLYKGKTYRHAYLLLPLSSHWVRMKNLRLGAPLTNEKEIARDETSQSKPWPISWLDFQEAKGRFSWLDSSAIREHYRVLTFPMGVVFPQATPVSDRNHQASAALNIEAFRRKWDSWSTQCIAMVTLVLSSRIHLYLPHEKLRGLCRRRCV